MYHGIHSGHIIDSHVPQILVLYWWQGTHPVVVEPGITVKPRIQSNNIIATLEQERRQYDPDIAVRSGHQYTHMGSPPPGYQIFQGALPLFQSSSSIFFSFSVSMQDQKP